MSSSEPSPADPGLDEASAALAARLVAAAERGEGIGDTALQELVDAVVRLYGTRAGDGRSLRALPAHPGATTTDVMVTATGLLRAVNVQLFELGLWQAWSGSRAKELGEAAPEETG